MKTLLAVSSIAALALSAFVATPAHAEDLTLTVGAGPSQVFHAPVDHPLAVIDNNKFQTGMSGEARGLVKLVPNLAVGAQAAVSQFSESGHHSHVADTWSFSAVAQLQGDHAAGWYPFLNASGGFAKSAQIYNPEMGASAGVLFALEETKTVFIGPYVSWEHTFQTHQEASGQTALIDHHDSNVGTVGLMLAFDAPVKPVHTTITNTVVETHTVVQPAAPARTVVQTVQVPVPTSMTLPMTVQFAKDSAVVDAAGQDVVGQVATAANDQANADTALTIEGYASAEGDTVYNLVLSQKRAAAVVELLAAKGVARSRMTVVSVGAVGALNDASNRKVDFVVHIAQQ